MKRALGILLLLVPAALFAQPLAVVNVNAPAVNHVFSPTGVITVTDTTAPFWSGGFLQSRYYQALAGSPAAGKYVYEYRVDLTKSTGILAIGAVTSVTITFGPNVKTLDFNGDKKPDDVFVVTSGGLGSVGLASAIRTGNSITFNFAGGGVAQGGSPGTGKTSYFFGIVSSYPKHNVTASLANTLGAPLSLAAWAPGGYPIKKPPIKPIKKP